jgi:hypothetical protein
MDTLMRNLKVLPLCGILLSGLAASAEAQGSWDGRGYYVDVSFGGQAQDETLSGASTFDKYGETGAVASAQSIGGGPFFDIAGGRRVWGNFGLGLAYTLVQTESDAAVSVRVPHPILRNQPREASATISDLEHSEHGVHVQLSWLMPITNEFKLMFMAGPSFFSARQEIAAVSPEDIGDVPPFTTVTINNVTKSEVKDSPVGFNLGVDGTYHLTSRYGARIGVGGFLRYTGAGADFQTDGSDGSVRLGGPQAGIGLRLRF